MEAIDVYMKSLFTEMLKTRIDHIKDADLTKPREAVEQQVMDRVKINVDDLVRLVATSITREHVQSQDKFNQEKIWDEIESMGLCSIDKDGFLYPIVH